MSLALLVSLGTICFAAESDDLAKENAELRQKVQKLDKDIEELKRAIIPQDDLTDTQIPKMVWSNLDIQIYGYLKLDAAYDSSRIMNGNYAQWVERENDDDNDNQFNMTANESRFGVKINGPDNGAMKTSGRAEVDFYGGGAENKSHLMMRHAYMKLDWPDCRFNIIAGQTSDVISPLYPSTVNYSVGWWTGNIGYRRPQIRLTKEYDMDEQSNLKLEGALTRTIGRDSLSGTDSGEDSGLPTIQGRASMTMPLCDAGLTTVGLSGHLGEEEYDTLTGDREFQTWSINLDVTQPLRNWLSIKGELFTGENLDAYLGGIGQGVTTSGPNQYEEIGSKGGWIAAGLGPWDKIRFNLGGGFDYVKRANVNNGGRTMNRSIFGNMYYTLNKSTEWALEVSNWETEYRGSGDADSLRLQAALIYKF